MRQGPGATGLSPSPAPLSRGLGPGPPLRTLLHTIRTSKTLDSQAGLFPVRSPLLGESWVDEPYYYGPTTYAQRELEVCFTAERRDARRRRLVFQPTASRSAHGRPISATARSPPLFRGRGGLEGQRCVTPRQACPRPNGLGRNLRSKTRWFTDSAIHTKYRISLRSSSMREPRYPFAESF
ncbi:hypothetical protein Dsin_032914 [Dipteronia sinensis]|uniref:Uncharacterized protein n=1 Tax=Dipteronia sinensis TaxID=43782 RepID=A0AAE0DQ70_9ROSI|nr:hypothetical protein Dsin_032914 [Dipteronia sinensis]